MKKALLVIGIILVALSIMAPDNEKAEKLKVDGHGWDNVSQFTVDMSCQFGIATVAEANGKFLADVTLDIFDYDQNGWDLPLQPSTS